MAVSEAIAHLLYWVNTLWVSLPATKIVESVVCCSSHWQSVDSSKNYISIGISLPDIISDDIININNDNHDNYNNDLPFHSNINITPAHDDKLVTKFSKDDFTTTKSPTRTSSAAKLRKPYEHHNNIKTTIIKSFNHKKNKQRIIRT